MKKVEKHPFYCHKKKCRKTAWDTPEYLTNTDWEFLKEIVAVVESGTSDDLLWLLWDKDRGYKTKDFFSRTLGWPEGYVYCQEPEYLRRTAFAVFKRDLPKLKKAMEDHKE